MFQVILLHRGVGDTRSKGLYSLKQHHSADSDAVGSHIIAFQDRGDATNFCSLLECFFKDLDDAYADVVPLSIKVCLSLPCMFGDFIMYCHMSTC